MSSATVNSSQVGELGKFSFPPVIIVLNWHSRESIFLMGILFLLYSIFVKDR